MDNVIVNKAESIERCLRRVAEERRAAGEHFSDDYTRQDAALLNLLRACEQAIDLANHVVRIRKLGVPQSSRDSFNLLEQAGIITATLAETMKKMVGFMNIAIHNYVPLEISIVENIIEKQLDDIRDFLRIALSL
jgi:uncharacterized protein YutE (UPF0331/DUF86 family)